MHKLIVTYMAVNSGQRGTCIIIAPFQVTLSNSPLTSTNMTLYTFLSVCRMLNSYIGGVSEQLKIK